MVGRPLQACKIKTTEIVFVHNIFILFSLFSSLDATKTYLNVNVGLQLFNFTVSVCIFSWAFRAYVCELETSCLELIFHFFRGIEFVIRSQVGNVLRNEINHWLPEICRQQLKL